MKRMVFIMCILTILSGTLISMAKPELNDKTFPEPDSLINEKGIQTAVLAGGCFWGMEGVFENLKGVTVVISGFSGGTEETATYRQVSTGKTGHAESVKITYNSSVISFNTLLKVFFSVAHDPTQFNYQGPDKGTEYRSAIFYTNEQQKKAALDYINLLNKSGIFADKIVTEVSPFKAFYPAEYYHQDFMSNNPDYPYIVYWDKPKLEHLIREYPQLVKNK